MKKTLLLFIMVFNIIYSAPASVIDDVIEMIFKSGDEVVEFSSKKAARETLERGVGKYGDEVLDVVRKGGIELLEASGKYGDEVLELAVKNPDAIYSLTHNTDEILGLVRKHGDKILELEGFAPGISKRIIDNFGDDAIGKLSKVGNKSELSRVIAYGEKADSPETRKLLWKNYEKNGAKFLDKIDYKMVMAGGLTTSMIITANNISGGVEEGIKIVAEENSEVLSDVVSEPINAVMKPFVPAITIFTVGLALLYLVKVYKKLFSGNK
ncbi:hypothetical protein PM10SUCC1_28260 [Propionigenium maris DSM 9537]|uniref:DUF4197 domain-containing protein n=1 Tax=Propionigenium maris DSM 9537 TaxID=1123000 RepID=A0A9W6GPC7_9FUSO|nr:hypothetical protein [Propionigenium maris]GLI57312.1 hypothetical protein PM10SUCC1_28260 [Propionigenium maris DSM 9537]